MITARTPNSAIRTAAALNDSWSVIRAPLKNSASGTFVNGLQMREAELSDGDEVRVGRTVMRFAKSESATGSSGRSRAGRGRVRRVSKDYGRGRELLELRAEDVDVAAEEAGWASALFASGDFGGDGEERQTANQAPGFGARVFETGGAEALVAMLDGQSSRRVSEHGE